MAVITQSGAWTAPAGVKQLRLILGQGGQGSSPGENGFVGSVASGNLGNNHSIEAGDGAQGVAGHGGKVWFDTIDINPQQQFQVVIGAGGAPSGSYGTPGSEGGETTFGAYSSANGEYYPNGFTDVASGTATDAPG